MSIKGKQTLLTEAQKREVRKTAIPPGGYIPVPRNTSWVNRDTGAAINGATNLAVSGTAYLTEDLRNLYGLPESFSGVWLYCVFISSSTTDAVIDFDSSDVADGSMGIPGSVRMSSTDTTDFTRGVFPVPIGADGKVKVKVSGATANSVGLFALGYYL